MWATFLPARLFIFAGGFPGLANRIQTSRHDQICLDVPHTLTICSSSCLSSVIFWFYCYFHCLYLRSRHNSKYFVVPVWAFSVVDEFISTFNVWVNLRFSAQIKAIRKDKLSHQSLNITSSSNAIVKILCHTITLFVTLVRINRGSR